MSAPLVLAAIIARLAACPNPLPADFRAHYGDVLVHESGLDALALHDNTTGEGVPTYPTAEAAVADARRRIAAGHKIDAGIAQVDSANWTQYGLTAETVFDPQRNLCAGADIWWTFLLRSADCGYNSGRVGSSCAYADSVAAIARQRSQDTTSPPPPTKALPVDAWTADDQTNDAPPSWDAWARVDWARKQASRSAEGEDAPAVVTIHASVETPKQ